MTYFTQHNTLEVHPPEQDFISTYEQKEYIVHAVSQITPTSQHLALLPFVICPLPTHTTQFLQNVAHFSQVVLSIRKREAVCSPLCSKAQLKMCLPCCH